MNLVLARKVILQLEKIKEAENRFFTHTVTDRNWSANDGTMADDSWGNSHTD